MKQPLVSVIIPNYNYGRYLRETLDSVLAQTYANFEIIVVDDGSQDDSEAVVATYEGVRFIKQKNQGVSAARNLGVKESSGEIVAFLDADDIWLPGKLEKQVQRIIDDPEVGLVHCGIQEFDAAGKLGKTFLEGMEGSVAREMLLLDRSVIIASGSTGMVPRVTFDAVGGFDQRLGTSADWEFCYRVAMRQQIAFVPEVLALYRIHGTNMHANIALMEHDVLIGYDKAFSRDDPDLAAIRRRAYGNAHMILAGSYFRAGQLYHAGRHSIKSLLYSPATVTRILGYPRRLWQRQILFGQAIESQSGYRASLVPAVKSETRSESCVNARPVSVIVPVRNEAATVERLIRGLQKQTYLPAEIVITDGGSSDGTREIINRLKADSPVPIKLVEDEDAFPGRGRNLAIKIAVNEWLAFIDAGIEPDQRWLEELVRVSEHNPQSQLVQGRYEPALNSYFLECAAISYLPRPGTVTPFIASCLLHRTAWESVGGFPEDLRSGEELIFFCKLKGIGVTRAISEKALVRWELQPDSRSTFFRFATYSRYNMKAGLAGNWQVRISALYASLLIFFATSYLWWPISLLPFVILGLRAQRRIYRWFEGHGKARQIFEVVNPRRVLTVTWINTLIDFATFCGMFEFFKRDVIHQRGRGTQESTEGRQEPKEVGL